ncbi:conserved hypothetical protein [Coccidioides posadasii str. Silveira]|uniref:Integrase zinc-binding domain-containing protein n=2 Tax=Coccidioides posadasii TaxID=199306 RepID=E9DF34_COCPS|nr:conserved hypothetical protein [Coccidioides posadasii str. Silveira]KMM70599.1 hypothetical protein CPAG_06910 [Coccidioides posadasii RMSCC 3488]
MGHVAEGLGVGEQPKSEEEDEDLFAFMDPNKGMDGKEYAKFCRKATKYVVEADQLFRRAGSGVPLRRVVDDLEQRKQILHMMHDEFGQKGREGTYSTLQARYWWPGMYKHVSAYVKHCSQCQLRDSQRLSEELGLLPVGRKLGWISSTCLLFHPCLMILSEWSDIAQFSLILLNKWNPVS